LILNQIKFKKGLDLYSQKIKIKMAFLGGLGKAPTFLVPIINPPFADNSPHLFLIFFGVTIL
jgi:hypothetical protein